MKAVTEDPVVGPFRAHWSQLTFKPKGKWSKVKQISAQFQSTEPHRKVSGSKFLTYLSSGASDLSHRIFFSQWTGEGDYRLIVGEIMTALTLKWKSSRGCCGEYRHVTFHSHGATEARSLTHLEIRFISQSASELFGEPEPQSHTALSHLSTLTLHANHHMARKWLDGSLTFPPFDWFSDLVPLQHTRFIYFCMMSRRAHEYPHLTHFS